MKKKIILIIFILIISFIIFNYKVILGNYYFFSANNDYFANNYSGALVGYNNSLNYLSGSKINFNKGNIYYKTGENEKNTNIKIEKYNESLNLYNNILEDDIKNKRQEKGNIRYNYEFVKNKLEELQEQEEQKEEESTENKETQEKAQEQQENNDDGDESNEEIKETNNTESGDYSEQMESFDLSEDDLKQIDGYVEDLKQEEKYNREYLNNIKPLGNNTFFDSIFDRGGEKDW
ncbi:MAG: hypothetical protein QM490_05910 [Candidatus Gracilibacteria bacterium]